jgi:hypothetical protein
MKSSSMKFILSAAVIGIAMGFAPRALTTMPQPASTTSLAFFGTKAISNKKSSKSSPLADEAVELYTAKFIRGSSNGGKFFFSSWGMPGSMTDSYQKPADRLIFARKNTELVASFNTLASLYGDDVALQMVKIQPGVLAFNKDNFQPSLEAFGTKFGIDEAKGMIVRNPGLLSVKPANAESADNLTMQLSYVVEFTRPIGLLGPATILALLSVPALESATGVGRGELLSSLF